MLYKAKAAVCSEIRTKHSTQGEHVLEFWFLNLVVRNNEWEGRAQSVGRECSRDIKILLININEITNFVKMKI